MQLPYRRASEDKSGLRFETGELDYLHIHVYVAYMVPYDCLWGHYSLQTDTKVKSDLGFEISNLNFLHIHVHIVYMVLYDGFWGYYSLQTASEVKSGLRDLHFLCDQSCRISLVNIIFPGRRPYPQTPSLRRKFRRLCCRNKIYLRLRACWFSYRARFGQTTKKRKRGFLNVSLVTHRRFRVAIQEHDICSDLFHFPFRTFFEIAYWNATR